MTVKNSALDHVFLMPKIDTAFLNRAKKTELKVLIYLFENRERGVDTASICAALGETAEAVNASLAFWRAAGVLSDDEEEETADGDQMPAITVSEAENATVSSRPALDTPSYSLTEIAQARSRNSRFASLLSYIEKLTGKLLNAAEQGIFLGLYDTVGMELDVIMGVAQYCVSKGKTSIRYMEKTALGIHDEGIRTYAELETYFSAEKSKKEYETIVKRVIGAEDRAFSPVENKHIGVWRDEYKASEELIVLAYSRTIERIGKPKIAYMSTILKDWHENGLDTPEKVAEFIEQHKGEVRKTETNGRLSFDMEDIFEKPPVNQ